MHNVGASHVRVCMRMLVSHLSDDVCERDEDGERNRKQIKRAVGDDICCHDLVHTEVRKWRAFVAQGCVTSSVGVTLLDVNG